MTEKTLRDDEDNPPVSPGSGTAAAVQFFDLMNADMRLLSFIFINIDTADKMASAIGVIVGDSPHGSITEAVKTETFGPRLLVLRKNAQALFQMFLIRSIDNFQTYVADLIRSVLRAKPSLLRTSKQTLTFEELLSYDRIEDLVHDIIERRVSSLTYDGFRQLQAWCAQRGIDVMVPEDEVDVLIELIATRNAISHNRGVVDEKYARAVPNGRYGVGQERTLLIDDLFAARDLTWHVVAETDQAAVAKFGLQTVPIPPSADISPPDEESG